MTQPSQSPTVTGVDNRGNREHPFGYVYFSDGNRLMFGDTVNGVSEYGLSTSNWGELPRKPYFEIAETAIRAALAPVPETDDDDDDECADCGESLEGHCEECGDCECSCGDEDDEECDECGCSANEFTPGCDCEYNNCPAGCGDDEGDK